MLNDFWVFISSLIIFIGLVASEGLLLVVGSLVLVLTLAARIWERFAFRSVTHSRSIGRQRAFIWVTHDERLGRQVSTRTLRLVSGRLEAGGPV